MRKLQEYSLTLSLLGYFTACSGVNPNLVPPPPDRLFRVQTSCAPENPDEPHVDIRLTGVLPIDTTEAQIVYDFFHGHTIFSWHENQRRWVSETHTNSHSCEPISDSKARRIIATIGNTH